MKKTLFAAALLPILSVTAQNFEWVTPSTATSEYIYPYGLAADKASNLFLRGENPGTSGQLDGHDIRGHFISRINSSTGKVDWVATLPPFDHFEPDNNGGVYVYANIYSEYLLGNDTIRYSPRSEHVIYRVDADGITDWYSTGSGKIRDLIADEAGNYYVLSGNVRDSVYYNGQAHLVPTPFHSTFLLESFSPGGQLRWSTRGLQHADTLRFMAGMELALDAHGNVAAWTDAVFDSQPDQSWSTAIAKFSTSGQMLSYIRAFEFGSSHSDAYGLQFDSHNNIYLYTGYYSYTLRRFDSLYQLTGSIDLAGYTSHCTRLNFLIDQRDNAYLAALYKADYHGNPLVYDFCGYSVSSRGEYNSGIHVLGGFGENCRAFYTTTGKSNDYIRNMCLDKQGNVYAAGLFKSLDAAGEPLAFGTHTLANGGHHEDLFVTKLGARTTAIHESPEAGPIVVFPNPAGAACQLTSPLDGQLKLFSTLGEVMLELPLAKGQTCNIETRGLSDGLYYLSLKDNYSSAHASARIIVRH